VLYNFAWVLCSLLLRLVYDFRSIGRRNIPRHGGVILAINHQPVVVGCGTTRPVHFMARATLFGGPFGALIRRLNAFPVERGGSDVRALREYIARVKSGNVVMLFPEGTRSTDGRLQALQPGVGMLAARAGAPIVPTYVSGTFRAWPRHRALPRWARVTIHYDRPVCVERHEGETKHEHQARVLDTIASRLARLERYCRRFQ
jgi:1-acyl-sn-glycerol-3-phosphate acyltransferase